MTYDPDKKAFIIPMEDIGRITHQLLWAMKHVRKASNLPLDAYEESPGLMQSADFAQNGIFDALVALGVSLPANRYFELDLRKYT